LQRDSKIPSERFELDQGGGSWALNADGMAREEIRFSRFINRLRVIFNEIIIKPLYLQMQVKFPELRDDVLFKTAIGLNYEEDNMFVEQKDQEIMNSRVDFINNMMGLTVSEMVDGMAEEKPFFDGLFLAEKYLKMSNADLERNQLYVNRRKQGLDPRTGKPLPKPPKPEGEEEGGDDMDMDF